MKVVAVMTRAAAADAPTSLPAPAVPVAIPAGPKTRLAPVVGLVRIASGRDAADIAFLTTQERCEVVRQSVTVAQA